MNVLKNWRRIGTTISVVHATFTTAFAVTWLGLSYADMLYYRSAPLSHAKAWKDAMYGGLLWPLMLYAPLRYGDGELYLSWHMKKDCSLCDKVKT